MQIRANPTFCACACAIDECVCYMRSRFEQWYVFSHCLRYLFRLHLCFTLNTFSVFSAHVQKKSFVIIDISTIQIHLPSIFICKWIRFEKIFGTKVWYGKIKLFVQWYQITRINLIISFHYCKLKKSKKKIILKKNKKKNILFIL